MTAYSFYPKWSAFELAQLQRLAAENHTCFEIARALGGRTASAVRTRAFRLSIKLGNPKFGRLPRDPDTTTWTDADKISAWALVPQELADLLVERAEEAHLPLKAVRSETRLPKYVAFRQKFSVEAHKRRFSFSAIGRALNRDHTTIIYSVRAGA